MKRIALSLTVLTLCTSNLFAFCGFYVAKADAKLFNKTSQVIMARDGDKTVITMSNDYSGPLSEFAMVVPVPEVLQRDQISTVNPIIFQKLDAYSAPRMAEYYDYNPCNQWDIAEDEDAAAFGPPSMSNKATRAQRMKDKSGVKIEAKYAVGEYDILILSATKSAGLEKWLKSNGYKIPEGAQEVLHPYIKSNMKFFVVKVNLDKAEKTGKKELNPLRISFTSDKFMLPIRLGMANANGDQDMIVYCLTKKGRVETTNYRTVKIPSNNEIPTFVQNDFGNFYKDVFKKVYKRENGKVAFLEYAWDVSMRQQVKCDPCVGPPPMNQDLLDAGVFWNAQSVFFTRLHVRYNRKNFPQDLMFHETSNNERFQGRYVIRHPAYGPFDCEQGKQYLSKLVLRREKELHELARLTGQDVGKHLDYVKTYRDQLFKMYRDEQIKTNEIVPVAPSDNGGGSNNTGLFYMFLGSLVIFLLGWPLLKRRLIINNL